VPISLPRLSFGLLYKFMQYRSEGRNIDASVSSYIVRNSDSVQREYMEVGGVYTTSL
jgi:hypothetical protein